MKVGVIITAGGSSRRFGRDKLLEKINSKEVIKHTVEAFLKVKSIEEIVISSNKNLIPIFEEFFKTEEKVKIIVGGNTRQESVYNGLKELSLVLSKTDYVLIHDGARPVITSELIEQTINEVQEKKALTVVTKTTDTIKSVDENLKIKKTIDRTTLYNTQTPQAFEYGLIKMAHDKMLGKNFTDDAGMIEALGQDVYVLVGDYRNIKITTLADVDIAGIYLRALK